MKDLQNCVFLFRHVEKPNTIKTRNTPKINACKICLMCRWWMSLAKNYWPSLILILRSIKCFWSNLPQTTLFQFSPHSLQVQKVPLLIETLGSIKGAYQDNFFSWSLLIRTCILRDLTRESLWSLLFPLVLLSWEGEVGRTSRRRGLL